MSDNREIWSSLYDNGAGYLNYVDDTFLKMYFSKVVAGNNLRVIDFGAGSGPISEFLVKQKHEVICIEPSISAQQTMAERVGSAKIYSDLSLANLARESVDLVVAWHVLYYLSEKELTEVLAQFAALMKPGAVMISTMLGENDIYISGASSCEGRRYTLGSAGQSGAQVLAYSVDEYSTLMPFGSLEIGSYQFSLGERVNHYHLLVTHKY